MSIQKVLRSYASKISSLEIINKFSVCTQQQTCCAIFVSETCLPICLQTMCRQIEDQTKNRHSIDPPFRVGDKVQRQTILPVIVEILKVYMWLVKESPLARKRSVTANRKEAGMISLLFHDHSPHHLKQCIKIGQHQSDEIQETHGVFQY